MDSVININRAPVLHGQVQDNFTTPESGGIPIAIHVKKENGNNYVEVAHGLVGILPGSDAEKCIKELMYGCKGIDILEESGKTYACFRDTFVAACSAYLELAESPADWNEVMLPAPPRMDKTN